MDAGRPGLYQSGADRTRRTGELQLSECVGNIEERIPEIQDALSLPSYRSRVEVQRMPPAYVG